jgi:hypothetical protein
VKRRQNRMMMLYGVGDTTGQTNIHIMGSKKDKRQKVYLMKYLQENFQTFGEI